MPNQNSTDKKTKVHDGNKKKTVSRSALFTQKYKWWILGTFFALIIVYVLIYLCFLGNGLIPPGAELRKEDWLSFFGTYLSFAGTLLISLIAILQSTFFEDRDKRRIADERKRAIQLILSVDIVDINKQIAYVPDVFSPYKPETMPEHKNVTIEIENVGQYPARNVVVFDKYLWQMLKPNEKKQIQIAYSDSPDIKRGKEHLIEILESGYARTDEWIPKDFYVSYDDVDGNEMYQIYTLRDYEGTQYYSLKGIYDA